MRPGSSWEEVEVEWALGRVYGTELRNLRGSSREKLPNTKPGYTRQTRHDPKEGDGWTRIQVRGNRVTGAWGSQMRTIKVQGINWEVGPGVKQSLNALNMGPVGGEVSFRCLLVYLICPNCASN